MSATWSTAITSTSRAVNPTRACASSMRKRSNCDGWCARGVRRPAIRNFAMLCGRADQRRDFDVDDGGVGMAHRERGTAVDAGRAVADHPVEFLLELGDDPGDAAAGERVLVTGL